MFFKSKVKVDEVEKEVEIVAKEEPVEQIKVEEEWIWVEGYKGTDKDMKCRDFQYELNKHYTHANEVKLCESGFHFCTQLWDVFNYYNLTKNNRFFKVKCLVKNGNHNTNKRSSGFYSGYSMSDSKMSAKEIIFLQELKFDDLKPYIESRIPFIETEEEYHNFGDYIEFSKNKFLLQMSKLGFSELYSYIKYMNFKDNKNLFVFLQRAKAYTNEGISKDIMIYLFETLQQNVDISTFKF